jgi:hypothetical protein
MRPYIDTTNRNFVTAAPYTEQSVRRLNQQVPLVDQNVMDLTEAFTSLD